MRTLTRERILADPARTMTDTSDAELPGAILLDQTGVHPLPFDAIFALDAPDTAFARVSPFRAGYRLLGAANADAERDQLPATFSVMGSALLYKGACVIVAHCDATGETVPLTLDELFYVLRHVYVLTTYGTPDANVVWMVDLPEGDE